MTKREFVEMLNKNFKDNEEITFLHDDSENGEERLENAEVLKHKQEYYDYQYYCQDRDGSWKHVSYDDYKMLTSHNFKGKSVKGELKTSVKKVIRVF